MHFRAAVLHRTGTPLVIEEVEMTGLGPRDVLVRLGASGLCHTDLEAMDGEIAHPLPAVLGHEGAGTVEAVGDAVTLVRPGDTVICSWNPNCGHCFYCDRDQPILCEPLRRTIGQGRLLDGGTRLRLRGDPLNHFSAVSSHAEYCVVPEAGAVPVPREIPAVYACLIGCGVMTGVGAACRFAKVPAGSHVVVLGAGAVGLNVVQGALLQRAASIVVIEPAASRRALAIRLGATHAVIPEAAADSVRRLTAGRGADYVFECAGTESTMRTALELCRPGGEVVILGKVNIDRQVSFRWGSMMGERRITRSSYGGARPRRDFPWLAQLYLDGVLDLESLVTERLTLDQVNEGFDRVRRGETVRSVLEFP